MKMCAMAVLGLATLWITQVAVASPAAITRDDQRDVMVTIYNGNLGLVKDVRETRLDSGVVEVRFTDVAAQIDPTSVHVTSLTDPGGLRILEQNYEYDLLTTDTLMEKYVGRAVRLYQSNGAYQDATLLSTNGPVYEIRGQIYTGHQGQVVFPTLSDSLVSRSTLLWRLASAAATPQRLEAAYLTAGITWKADYVMVIDAADARGDLAGWVTIDNKSGATYGNAALKLVAGDVHRAPSRDESRRVLETAARHGALSAVEKDFRAEGFFEYHLYTLDGRTTIKDRQTKQLSLMAAGHVPVDKRFIYAGARDYFLTEDGLPMTRQKVGVYLEMKNDKAHRLGLPLPKGKVRVYKADASGSRQLVGEDWIDHTPVDEMVKIKMGDAFDVVGERVQRDWKRLGAHVYEVEWDIALRNHKKEAISVEVIEPVPGDWEVLRSTLPHDKVEAFSMRFRVPVPAEGEAKLNYRVRVPL